MRPTPNRYPQEGSRWIDLLLLAPLALITAALGFWLSSTLAAWVVPSALALTGIGVAAAVGLPAVLSLGHRLRFFLKAVIVSNAVALFGAILLIPGGVQQAVRKNGAWAAKAVAPYLPAPQKAALPEAAARLSEILAERLPDGPGALSYLFPEPEEAPPKVKVAPSKGAGEAAVVKFKKNGASIIVKAELNGAATVPMIYDTGASLTTIDGDTARRLGISLTGARYIDVETANGPARQPVVTLSSIQVGGARVEGPIEVAICEACSISGAVGLLGLNFSSAFITEIDPGKGAITFRPRK